MAQTTQGTPSPGASAAQATRLVLIRHGRTDHTHRRLLSGCGSDPDLDELGQQDAQAAGQTLRALVEREFPEGIDVPDAIYVSPMRRARSTAKTACQVVCEAHPDSVLPEPVVDEMWREISFGDWEGLTFEEVFEQDPAAGQQWVTGSDFSPPGGENLDAFRERVGQAVSSVVAKHPGEKVWIFAHAGVIGSTATLALGSSPFSQWQLSVHPGSVNVFDYWPESETDRLHSRILMLNYRL